MTIATIDRAPTAVPTELARGRGGGGPASKRIVVAYGFWIFILSDIVMFSALFAAYAVLSGNTAGGPTGRELFDLAQRLHRDDVSAVVELYVRARGVVRRTAAAGALPDLRSPHIRARCGLSVHRGLGICRHGGEGRRALAQRAFCPASSLWSARTASTSPAGLICARSIWWPRSIAKGLRAAVLRRLLCWSLFWHALDIVWVGVFTLVYLMGDSSDGRSRARVRRPHAGRRRA